MKNRTPSHVSPTAQRIEAAVECPIEHTFRAQQVAGMFDLQLHAKAGERFSVELPSLEEPWQIGLIVGPSGSGKTTVARTAYGDKLAGACPWPAGKPVVDGFPEAMGIREITQLLTAVGFSSPPAWLKPYAVLSNGERFRCDLARALVSDPELVAFDEFTSVVDRTVARIGSSAIAKAIRRGSSQLVPITSRFVAVSCHYDIAQWLEPDWVLDMATGELARGRLCRPPIRFAIRRCQYGAWAAFARHHYLTRELHASAQCYLGLVEEQPAVFAGILPTIGLCGHRRVSRLVVLPDYQGVGVGRAMLSGVAKLISGRGEVLHITTSHPAMVRALASDPSWQALSLRRHGRKPHTRRNENGAEIATSTGRPTANFVYRGVT